MNDLKPTKLFLLTAGAMICFAANSLLCRLALKQTSIDAASFTSVRIIAGASVLYLILKLHGGNMRSAGNWLSALALFTYAAAFSFAYLSLSAGTGALLLFAAVQTTMILHGFRKGERFDVWQRLGFALAIAGLVLLLLPGLSAPSISGSVLMLSAGMAWGIYSLRGKGADNPARATTGNFLRAVPFTLMLSLASLPWIRLDPIGIEYAIISGAITSGLGYVIWYAALTDLKSISAATVQLSVPVLAALGGILFLGEPTTSRFIISSVAVLGGIALVLAERNKRTNEKQTEIS
jgi:drug/metabolite transporter (DMT)-like permease